MRYIIALLFALPLSAQIHVEACTPTDAGFTGGLCYTSPTTLPAGAASYLQKERYGNFSYHFAVSDGQYTVVLHFIENSTAITSVGQRSFSVSINGAPVITALDLAATALNTPIDKSFAITASGGTGITIQFTMLIRNAVVSAIDIAPVAVTPPANPFPGCVSDGNGGIACTGSIAAGSTGQYDAAITFGGITYRWPSGDGTGKTLKDSGVAPCGNMDPHFLATNPVCHQFIWQ